MIADLPRAYSYKCKFKLLYAKVEVEQCLMWQQTLHVRDRTSQVVHHLWSTIMYDRDAVQSLLELLMMLVSLVIC